jgi:phenylacetate-CoA ligase
MKIKGTTVYPAAVQRTLQSIEQIIDYVMIASAPTALSDELEVVVAWKGDATDAGESIREKLRGDLKVCPVVRIAPLAEIQALGLSNELRKQRMFIDRRKQT